MYKRQRQKSSPSSLSVKQTPKKQRSVKEFFKSDTADNQSSSQSTSQSSCSNNSSRERNISKSTNDTNTNSLQGGSEVKAKDTLNTTAHDIAKQNPNMATIDTLIERLDRFEAKISSQTKSLEKYLKEDLTEKINSVEKNIRAEFSQKNNEIEGTIHEFQKSLEFTDGQVKDLEKQAISQRAHSNQLAEVVSQVVSALEVIKVQNEEIKMQTRKSQDYSRKINLLFVGIDEKQNEVCTKIVGDILEKQLKLTNAGNIKLQECHRLGPYQNQDRPRPIIAKFKDLIDRNKVLQAKSNLASDSKLRIAEHYSQETTATRKALAPLIKTCKDAGKKNTLVGDEIMVESKKYSLEGIQKLSEAGIDPQAPCTRRNSQVLAFNGKLSMLSNFYLCRFYVDNQTFYSNEQYFQFKKAQQAGMSKTAAKILATKDPVIQKQLGRSTKLEDDQWNSYDIMKKGNIAKFSHNNQLWNFLKSTDGLDLQHANKYDEKWGTGVNITDRNVLTKPGTGKNLLGKMLMDIRDNNLIDRSQNSSGYVRMPLPLAHPHKQKSVLQDVEEEMDDATGEDLGFGLPK